MYDPETLADEADTAQRGEINGEIIDITESTAEDIFGEAATNPDREMIDITVEISVSGDSFTEALSLPIGPSSWANPKFRLGKFHEKYGELPTVDMVVDVSVDRDGYYRISLD